MGTVQWEGVEQGHEHRSERDSCTVGDSSGTVHDLYPLQQELRLRLTACVQCE